MAPVTESVDLKEIELPHIAALSIDEALPLDSKGELEKRKVVLVNDIWYMVFAELVKGNYTPPSYADPHRRPHISAFGNWLRACRFVSQDFDMMVKPLGYSLVDLSGLSIQDRLPNVSGPLRDSFLATIQVFTTFLQLPNVRDVKFEAHVSQLIKSCRKLKRIQFENRIQRWDRTDYDLSYLLSLWLSSFLHNKRKLQGYRVFSKSGYTVIEQVVTPWHDETFADELCDDATRLSIDQLDIDFSGRTLFNSLAPTGDRLPAMNKLFLTNYQWEHPLEEFGLVWDFSELEILSLNRMNLMDFFAQVPMDNMQQLVHLEMEEPIFEPSDDGLLEELQEVTRTLMRHIFSRLSNLQSLIIACDELHIIFPVDVITGVLKHIRSLDLIGNYDEQPITLTSLHHILLAARKIESLCLEFSALDADALKLSEF
ncbi:hypothetical protein BKA64DRAFT_744383 [Cadophora sp. MPI-SDFR-AT-0126]|nr:hypothetical protein BKA64DRAFT_744383 [Leotiomycetes sp. MPI-SDFR-AT-0126]